MLTSYLLQFYFGLKMYPWILVTTCAVFKCFDSVKEHFHSDCAFLQTLQLLGSCLFPHLPCTYTPSLPSLTHPLLPFPLLPFPLFPSRPLSCPSPPLSFLSPHLYKCSSFSLCDTCSFNLPHAQRNNTRETTGSTLLTLLCTLYMLL